MRPVDRLRSMTCFEVFAEAVHGGAALDRHAHDGAHRLNLMVLFWPDENGFGKVFADFFFIDIKGGDELDITDVVVAQL